MSDQYESERRHTKRGPINGKVGWALAVIEQMKTLIGILIIGALAFGFKWSTPGQELTKIREELGEIRAEIYRSNEKQSDLERMVKALTRLQCDKVTTRDARLAQLECGAIQ